MTCVVAVKRDGMVVMGADSAATLGHEIITRKDPKIYVVGEFMFGFTTSFRMGQLLGYCFKPPCQSSDTSIERFMAVDFINAVRDTFVDGGFQETSSDVISGGEFLVAYRGRVFHVYGDYQVAESVEDFDACGCGAEIALGSLYSTRSLCAEERVKMALSAAETFSNGVRSPFKIVCQ